MGFEPVSLVIRSGGLRWFGCVQCKYDIDLIEGCMAVEVEGIKQTACPRKTWYNDVKEDVKRWSVLRYAQVSNMEEEIKWANC